MLGRTAGFGQERKFKLYEEKIDEYDEERYEGSAEAPAVDLRISYRNQHWVPILARRPNIPDRLVWDAARHSIGHGLGCRG
jgi:hypothetical protein